MVEEWQIMSVTSWGHCVQLICVFLAGSTGTQYICRPNNKMKQLPAFTFGNRYTQYGGQSTHHGTYSLF